MHRFYPGADGWARSLIGRGAGTGNRSAGGIAVTPWVATSPASADVDPGGFCDDSEVGDTVTNANGRSYTCGGHGTDKNGHFHWNTA